MSRSDAHFPLSTAGRHPPSMTKTILEGEGEGEGDMALTPHRLSVRVRAADTWEYQNGPGPSSDEILAMKSSKEQAGSRNGGKNLEDLPLEIQGLILDYLFGDIHSVTSTSASLQPGVKRVSSAMRHPRRKALTDVALVSLAWRELVQERIYRHIKIKGNRAGLAESTNWFSENPHLTKHVRHIEVWVPVWADKRPEHQKTRFIDEPTNLIPAYLNSFHSSGPGLTISSTRDIYNQTNDLALHVNETNEGLFTYPFSNGTTSATLSEVFSHIAYFFSQAQIFTLEGGHCKKSRMIRQFPATLFPAPDRRLDVLPNIRTFAMRGAWNIMRDYGHWTVLERALPAVQEWHCAYAKPRPEAYTTINLILSHLPRKLRHVNISLDGFYCKDVIEGNGVLASSPQSTLPNRHLCERLGKIAPQLETLSFTGRICECFFRIATEVARTRKEASQLRAIDIVVKSCCRLMVVNKTPTETNGENGLGTEDGANEATSPDFPPTTTTTTAAAAAASALQALIPSPHSDTLTGITNMIFIRSFERLILSAVKSLDLSAFPSLAHIRIRFIDLDSACPLLNPYFVFSGPEGGRCAGVWNEEILEALWRTRPDAVGWEELGEGIERDWEGDGGLVKGGGGGVDGSSRISLIGSDGVGMMGVRRKPTAIRGSAYRNLAEAR